MDMVKNTSIDIESLWKNEPDLAMGLISAREFMFGKARSILGNDIEKIHGK